MADAVAVRYAAPSTAEHLRVVLEGFAVLYDRRSGATHILAPPAPDLLDALGEGEADAGQLLARLGGSEVITAEDDPVEVIAARLAELEAIGLVARA